MNQERALADRLSSSAVTTLNQVDPRAAAEDAVSLLDTYRYKPRSSSGQQAPSDRLADVTLALGVIDALCGDEATGVAGTPLSLPPFPEGNPFAQNGPTRFELPSTRQSHIPRPSPGAAR
eukprot:TRINITY_DN10430_c0_g1_i1.p2 TRINITY_DN10430_c0_g1~~TRINITY_DN10430_c0_g1_i1.p2  ORF type:complete len:120 (-),score=8.89 TRINITY_DN10430_c0_g1_i1:73-432(-)